MKKKLIRNGVWETNSSSTHSVNVNLNSEFILDTSWMPDAEGKVYIKGGEYGWEVEDYIMAQEKANYVAQAIGISDNLIEVVKEFTGADEVVFGDLSDGYIDHQSLGLIKRDKEWLKYLIFSRNSSIHTDSDG